jgi:hypothetical protein
VVEAVGLFTAQSGSALRWRDQGFAYLTAGIDTEPARLYGWHPDTGLEVLYTAVTDEALSGLIYDAVLDRLYFDRRLNGIRTVSWLDEGSPVAGVVVDSVYSGTYSRQINSLAEGLYLCTTDTNLWVFLDTVNDNTLVTDKACSLSDKTVQTTRQTCLQSDDRLWCTGLDSTDSALVAPFELSDLTLLTLDSVNDTLLLMIENPAMNATGLSYYTPGDGEGNLIIWQQLDIRHNLVVEGQTMTLAIGLDQLELYRWQPGEALEQFNSPYFIDSALSWYQLPIFVTGETVHGMVQLDASNYEVYRFALATETFETLIELGPESTPIEATSYELLNSPRGLAVGTAYGDGQCHWQQLTQAGDLDEAYLDNTTCNDRLVTPSVEIHRNYNDVVGRYYRVSGSEFVGQTLMQLDVSDQTGNNTVMPIELDVVEAP